MTVWKNSYAEQEVTGKTYIKKKKSALMVTEGGLSALTTNVKDILICSS